MDIMSLFLHLLNISISASVFALAIILFRFIFKKSPKWLVVGLWALVAIRLICPFSIESALSLIPSKEAIPQEIFTINTATDMINNTSFGFIENPAYSEYFNSTVTVEDVSSFQRDFRFAADIWLIGVGIMLLYALISYLRLRHTVRTAIPLRENVRLCDSVKSPFILGVFRPRIYLPSDMDEDMAELVLKHEKAHLKRRDHLWKPLGFVLLSVYWFNPVLWLSYVLLCRDIELACDEKVIRDMEGTDKKAYSEALLSCSVGHRMISACPVAFGEVGVKKRIKSVLNYKKPAFWIILIAVVVSVVLALCFMTDPKEQNGGTLTFNGVDEISELTFPMEKILSNTYSYTIYNGNTTTDDYFVAKSEDIACFREVSSFLKELTLDRIVDGEVTPMHEPQTNAVIKLSYSEPLSVSIIFHDNFTKMYMNHSSDGLYTRSKDYYVADPDKAKKFFTEKPYMTGGLVWEYNLASSAWGHSELVFLLDEKYQINGKVKGKGKISTLTNEDMGAEGISWSPEFLDGPDEYNIEIPVIAEGKEKLFSLTVSKVGKKALSTYFTVRADNLVIAVSEEPYKFVLSEPEDPDNLQWYYNPSLIAEGYTQLSFMLPDGYTIASREIQRNGQSDISDYNAEAAITEFKWSPDYDNIMETGKLDMTVTAVKDRETVDYKITLTPVSKDEKGGIYFDIEPLNCIITQYSWATYQFEEKPGTPDDGVIWSYNPSAGATWWYQTKYILPEGYKIKSAEATSGETTIEDLYYDNPDNLKCVCWTPGEDEKETELVITALKEEKNVAMLRTVKDHLR